MGIFKHLQDEIDDREKREGITLAELLDLSPVLRRLMNRVTRHGELTAKEATEELDISEEEAEEMLGALIEKGYLLREKRDDVWVYRVYFARKRGTSLPSGIWSALGDKPEESDSEED
jgi:predicted ArsR family transcriptional regulator